MEGTKRQPPASLIPMFWAPGWNSVQSAHKFLPDEVFSDVRCLRTGLGSHGYFNQMPAPFRHHPGEWLILSVSHVFGTEELSAVSLAIKALAPLPYLAINSGHAERLGLAEGQKVRLSVQLDELALHLDPRIPEGVALIPSGLPGMPFIDTPVWGTLR